MQVPRVAVVLVVLVALFMLVSARTQPIPASICADQGWAGPYPSQIRSFSGFNQSHGARQLVPPLPITSPFRSFVVTDVFAGNGVTLSDGSFSALISSMSFRAGLVFDARAGVTGQFAGSVVVAGYYF